MTQMLELSDRQFKMTMVAKLKLMRTLDDNSKILPVECLNERAAMQKQFSHTVRTDMDVIGKGRVGGQADPSNGPEPCCLYKSLIPLFFLNIFLFYKKGKAFQ